jgi:enterochelin esterase family protein
MPPLRVDRSTSSRLLLFVPLLLAPALALAQPAATAPAPPATAPATPDPNAPPPLDVATLRRSLGERPSGEAALRLADKLRRWFGADVLKNGMAAKTEGLEAAFAIEVPGARAVAARSLDGLLKIPLFPIAGTTVWATVATLADGTALRFAYDVDGRRIGAAEVETFAVPADSVPQPGVPKGKVIAKGRWRSALYPGTERDWWIYVPAQYHAAVPIGVMVFQDGGVHFVKPVPTVFDNLIAKGEMPVTAAVFINPGVFADGRRNRSVEYETMSDTYARFLLEEILPEVEKTVKLRKDPASRAIGGMSSGALAAFTAAWQRPDQFGKVLSWVGSYTNLGVGAASLIGGHNYPPLIRRSAKKPIRIFMQDGEQDLEQDAGSWTLANKEMERALTFAGWDFRMVWGKGFHSTKNGYAVFPEALRWLWRDFPRGGVSSRSNRASDGDELSP